MEAFTQAFNDLSLKFDALQKENEELKKKLEEKNFKLPCIEEFDDDNEAFEKELLKCMTSGDLSNDELKEAFKRLVDSSQDEWSWISDELFETPHGKLWRIYENKIQINRYTLYRKSEWMDIEEVYNDRVFVDIGRHFNRSL